MPILPLNFSLFGFCGIWRPVNWPSKIKYLYSIYTSFILFLIYSLTIMETIGFLFIFDKLEDLINISFLLITMFCTCYKATNILVRRENIIILTSMMSDDSCKPRNTEEEAIKKKFDHLVRSVFLGYVLSCLTASALLTSRTLTHSNDRKLPLMTWIPYEITTPTRFWITYVHQNLAFNIAAAINSASDALFAGFMVQICAQIEILNYRLTNLMRSYRRFHKEFDSIPSDLIPETTLKRCIRHHNHIFKFSTVAHDFFSKVIFIQFFGSVVSMCSSIFLISRQKSFTMNSVALIVYLFCMLLQIFLYCWYGNEVQLKSKQIKDAIYNMEWFSLKINTKKSLLMFMMRAMRPIKFTGGLMITLDLDIYVKILKVSYSAYTVLKRTSEN